MLGKGGAGEKNEADLVGDRSPLLSRGENTWATVGRADLPLLELELLGRSWRCKRGGENKTKLGKSDAKSGRWAQ